jgi:hypothetical protein
MLKVIINNFVKKLFKKTKKEKGKTQFFFGFALLIKK